ncbi:sugar phosphate isomerase/epimerase [Caldilinea sp.]|uniref:sugar phosphate isomerase/epimerase family protein n=1 Tax=Caldilinea sp. TaxID=2293560 RepID=UPI002C05349C|nr:sugar phosphate isomerase/epimerase [Caldilinea sp.]HRA66264.1 sugar phosphate isomerase/epimerase [Caldilinea sp.]
MLLGFHGATTMTSDLETDVRVSREVGYQGLELWADKVYTYLETHSLEELNALFVDNGVAPLSLNALVFVGFRGNEYAQVQQRCKVMCEIAEAIGCPMLVTVPSPTETRWQLPWPAVVAEYVTVLRDLAEIAAPHKVRLSFEFLGFGWCTVRTPRGAWEIVQAVDRPNVGMTVDCAHLYAGGGLIEELDALDPAKVFAFHLDDLEDTCKEAITDNTRLYPGSGVIPLDEICQRMAAIGYDDACSIELFQPAYWELDPLEVARQCRASALKVLSPYFSIT